VQRPQKWSTLPDLALSLLHLLIDLHDRHDSGEIDLIKRLEQATGSLGLLGNQLNFLFAQVEAIFGVESFNPDPKLISHRFDRLTALRFSKGINLP
jgi:hypothetical protein